MNLSLYAVPLSNERITQLAALKNLKVLTLGKTGVSAAAMQELSKQLPQCKIEWEGGVIGPK